MSETAKTWPDCVRNPDSIRLIIWFEKPVAGLLGYTVDATSSAFDASRRAHEIEDAAVNVKFGLEARYDDVTALHAVDSADDVVTRYQEIATASERAKLAWARLTA